MQKRPGLDGHLELAGFHATSNCALENITNDRLMDAVHEIQKPFSIFFFLFLLACVTERNDNKLVSMQMRLDSMQIT